MVQLLVRQQREQKREPKLESNNHGALGRGWNFFVNRLTVHGAACRHRASRLFSQPFSLRLSEGQVSFGAMRRRCSPTFIAERRKGKPDGLID
jgi:hypothetical protein